MLQPFCSVIVLNYQGEKIISKTLESLLALNYPKERYEIIVVDNGSNDNSKKVLKGIKGIQTLYLPRNLGFSAGNNEGIRQAKGEYVMLLNNDCIVDGNWLNELVKTAEKDEKTFSVNPKVYLGYSKKIQNAGIKVFSNGYAQDIGAAPKNKIQDYEEDKGQYDIEKDLDATCAVATLYRKSVFEKIGFFDERFFLYYEDVEISFRAKRKGYKLVYNPKAIAYHHHAYSSSEGSPFFIFHSERGRLLFLFLEFPLSVFFIQYLRYLFMSTGRLILRITKPNTFQKNLSYLKAAFSLIWQK